MKKISVPGLGEIIAEHLVLDYNGTIAKDGKVIEGVKDKLKVLRQYFEIHILTADTYGTVHSEFEDWGVDVRVMSSDDSAIHKRKIVESFGQKNSICIGNGYNDIEMMKVAGLSISVIQEEGASGRLLIYSDLVFSSITDALESLGNTDRIVATLRA